MVKGSNLPTKAALKDLYGRLNQWIDIFSDQQESFHNKWEKLERITENKKDWESGSVFCNASPFNVYRYMSI